MDFTIDLHWWFMVGGAGMTGINVHYKNYGSAVFIAFITLANLK